MLKVKRIAKVILSICIAFSMFISVSANNIFSGTIYNGSLSGTANSTSISLRYNVGDTIFDGITIPLSEYKINVYVPNINSVDYKNIFYVGLTSLTYGSIVINVNDNTITNNVQYFSNISYNNNILKFTYNNISTNFYGITIMYQLNQKGNVYTIDEPTSPYFVILKDSPTNNLVNIIGDTINNIIIYINNIFSFITDKPWIILIGVTVSLLSFLIYKAKSII